MDNLNTHVPGSFVEKVEQCVNPGFIGLAVVVGSDPKKGKGRGVVSTCSYEARSFGIHSGMRFVEVQRFYYHPGWCGVHEIVPHGHVGTGRMTANAANFNFLYRVLIAINIQNIRLNKN